MIPDTKILTGRSVEITMSHDLCLFINPMSICLTGKLTEEYMPQYSATTTAATALLSRVVAATATTMNN